jgi:opacity protein-like surface antigen
MKARVLILTGLLCFMCSVVSAQDVYVTSSPSANFSQYHTYAWGQQKNPNEIASSFLAQEATTQINNQLQSKALKMVQETENPDSVLVAGGGMKTQTSYNAMGMRGIGGGVATISAQQNVEGTLIVDIYDLKAKELV